MNSHAWSDALPTPEPRLPDDPREDRLHALEDALLRVRTDLEGAGAVTDATYQALLQALKPAVKRAAL